MASSLRFVTYLTPSYPVELFEAIADYAADAVGRRARLDVETRWSGPPPGRPDPFSIGSADVGFMCSPSYLRLTAQDPAPIELLPAPVFDVARNEGRPVYFCDVIVHRDSPVATVTDLGGATWSFNDEVSLSGYWSMLAVLDKYGLDREHLGESRKSGSHLASIQAVAAQAIDTAIIDGNVWPGVPTDLVDHVTVIESVGPFPAQPMVVRASLDTDIRNRIAGALVAAGGRFFEFGVTGFAEQPPELFAAERDLLVRLGMPALLPPSGP